MPKTQVDVTHDFDPIDILKVVNKKPGFAYRWVKKANVEIKRMHGWQPVIKTAEEIERSAEYGLGIGKVIERGDLILCHMPVKLNEQLKAAKRQKAKRQMDAIKRAGMLKHGSKKGRQTGSDALETMTDLGIGVQHEVLAEKTDTEPGSTGSED